MVDPEQLPQVRAADCGCILLADVLPVGFRYRITPTGDARDLVYTCAEHDRTKAQTVVKKATRVQLGGKKLTPGG